MACFRCGKIQTDPVRGASPWARLVIKGEQVLICPTCQTADPDWKVQGDRCRYCSSTRLVVVMGSLVCKQCGRDTPKDDLTGRPEGANRPDAY